MKEGCRGYGCSVGLETVLLSLDNLADQVSTCGSEGDDRCFPKKYACFNDQAKLTN